MKNAIYGFIAAIVLALILMYSCDRKTVTIDRKEYQPIGMHHGVVVHDTLYKERVKYITSRPKLTSVKLRVDTSLKWSNLTTYTDTLRSGGTTVVINDSIQGDSILRNSVITSVDTIYKESKTDTMLLEKKQGRFTVAPFIGIGIGADGKPMPMVGVGIGFRLFSF